MLESGLEKLEKTTKEGEKERRNFELRYQALEGELGQQIKIINNINIAEILHQNQMNFTVAHAGCHQYFWTI